MPAHPSRGAISPLSSRSSARRRLWRAGWIMLLAVSGALALLVPMAARAQTQTLPRLQGQVTDLTRDQVLAGGRGQIDRALAGLLQRHNVQLFVLFVDSTAPRNVTAYADETARQNSLGGNDALLVVAVGDRSDAIWRGSQSLSRLTDRELETVLTRRVEPLLARGDFPAAVAAAADGIGQVAGTGSQTGAPRGGGGGISFSWLLAPILLLGGGLFALRAFSGRRREQGMREEHAQDTERLVHEANALLIAVDERLRDAREEIGFAEAQFTEADVAPFRQAVKRASDELVAAFSLRQRLDDAEPESDDERRQIVAEITERAQRAQALLDEQGQHIEQLRDLQRTAPEVLAALPDQIRSMEARIAPAERTLAGMSRYAESSYASVEGNIEAAREALTQARTAATEGQQSLSGDDRPMAGRQARTAQQALAEAGRLLDAIDSLAVSLRQANEAARPQLAAAAADVRTARVSLAGSNRADLQSRLAQAEAALAEAERELAAERPDVLLASRLIMRADDLADAVLAEVQQDEERRERTRRLLDNHMQAAESDYDRVSEFIAARRRLIGSEPRTRLAEAGRHLDRARALAGDDPETALAEARRAQELTEDAYTLAAGDVEMHQPYGGGWGSPLRGGVILPMPLPIPIGGGWLGGGFGGGFRGGFGGGVSMGGGGGSVGGRW